MTDKRIERTPEPLEQEKERGTQAIELKIETLKDLDARHLADSVKAGGGNTRTCSLGDRGGETC